MTCFLIQSVNGEIVFDFAFHLKEAIKYTNWFNGSDIYEYQLIESLDDINENTIMENPKSFIPIGSVEFVLGFYKQFYNIKNIKPINIPDELNTYDFLKRKIFPGNNKDEVKAPPDKNYFIKDISGFKKETKIVKFSDVPNNKNWLVSEEINILSEWRCFIYNKKLLDIRSYLCESFVYPNVQKIEKMIQVYQDSPAAYSLDVAVKDSKETVLLEVHDFFSVGLYGFMDYRYLPEMFISTHRGILGV